MKRVAVVLVLAFAMTVAFSATASAGSQKIDTLMGKVIENLTLTTDYGNVYFNVGDVKRMVHAAAKLRAVDLGDFTTDSGQTVRVRVTQFDRGVATFLIVTK